MNPEKIKQVEKKMKKSKKYTFFYFFLYFRPIIAFWLALRDL